MFHVPNRNLGQHGYMDLNAKFSLTSKLYNLIRIVNLFTKKKNLKYYSFIKGHYSYSIDIKHHTQ